MEDVDKTKEQLIIEVVELRQRNAELTDLQNNEKIELKKLYHAYHQISAIYDAIPGLISVVDKDYCIIDINQSKMKVVPDLLSKEDFIGKKCYKTFKKSDKPCQECRLPEVFKTGESNFRYSTPYEDELTGKSFKVYLQPIKDKSGNVISVIELAMDITDRIKLKKQLEYQLSFFQELLDAIPTPIFYKNIHGLYMGCNKAWVEQLGLTKENIVGKSVYEVFPQTLADKLFEMDSSLFRQKGIQIYESQIADAQGLLHDVIFNKATFSNQDGSVGGLIGVLLDITERKRAEEKLNYISTHDALTGVYNRTYFEKEIYRPRNDCHTHIGLVICDIDGLKLVNDTFGHLAGDKLLISAAEIIKTSFSPNDIIARIGGDEFAIILANCTKENIQAACDKIRHEVEKYNSQELVCYLSISIGYAISDKLDLQSLFKEADNYMYREKLHSSNSTRSGIINTIMQLLKARDYITEGHADRLQDLVSKLAIKCGLSENKIADLRLLAKFHDLGKVGIPDRILLKPGRLTNEEKEEMKTHAEIGYRISQSLPDLIHISDWILKHHEWWNGDGYPLGLKEDKIPLECRILSLADAYDAMTSDRPYRKAMSRADAISELRKFAGIQFDPNLVELFIYLVEENPLT